MRARGRLPLARPGSGSSIACTSGRVARCDGAAVHREDRVYVAFLTVVTAGIGWAAPRSLRGGHPVPLSRSAHVDTFCRDNLPPESEWPELLFDIADVRYPDRLNCAVELLDAVAQSRGADRPCVRAPGQL